MRSYKKKNNKGFTLLELVIAIFLFSLVAIPLLQAFTVSLDISTKSRKIGEATAAAQNIQEAIEAKSVAAMLNQTNAFGNATGHMQNESALKFLGYSEAEINDELDTTVADELKRTTVINTDTEKSILLKNLQAGSKTFNAKVFFETGNYDAADGSGDIGLINKGLIAQYTDMTGTFSQPYASNQNPDELSKSDYEVKYPASKYTQISPRTRTIKVIVSSEPKGTDESEGYLVFVTVDFIYTYKHSWTDTVLGVPTVKTGTTNITYTYSVFPGGYPIKSYDDEVACYLMYYPFYEYITDNVGILSYTENINLYVDYDNDDSDLKFKLFLIKQWPMVLDANGNKVPADKNSTLIKLTDRGYFIYISEYHSDNFELLQTDSTHAHESMMNIYTNANVLLDDSVPAKDRALPYTYRIKKPVGRFVFFEEEAKAKNQLVKTQQEDRLYNVTIRIYNEDTDIDANPDKYIYELKAKKLK